ncbi:unnamed protein product [Trichobilharzia szidati]|nr:unnamed protein product [Trichobilharzia szidati]
MLSDWKRPDLPSRCTFSLQKAISDSPHRHLPLSQKAKIVNSAVELIGNTPLVRIDRIARSEGIECELLAKCEFFNIGGSVKDRIGRRMIEEEEKEGRLKPGDTIIVPTSGNTGIGLALVAAIKGYRCIIVMSDKMSREKESYLHALGAETVRTPASANFDGPDSPFLVSEKIKREIGPSAHIIDQYTNPYNPIAHFDETAEEIFRDCTNENGKIWLDMLVVGAGTGGTISGLSRKMKMKLPNCVIVGVDPIGSILADPSSDEVAPYDVEGIGYDFIPTVCDRSGVDEWCKTDDHNSFEMARRLIREEGLPCGGSSGAAVLGAIKAIKKHGLGKDHRVVVLLPDGVRNYMTKFLTDDWMFSRGYMNFPLGDSFRNSWITSKLDKLLNDLPKTVRISTQQTIKQASDLMKSENVRALIVQNENKDTRSTVLGIFDSSVLRLLFSGSVKPSDSVVSGINKNFRQVEEKHGLDRISRELTVEPYVVVWKLEDPYLVCREDFLHWSLSQQ